MAAAKAKEYISADKAELVDQLAAQAIELGVLREAPVQREGPFRIAPQRA